MHGRVSPKAQAIVLFVVVVLSRIPFFPPNSGIDDDGYRILLAGRVMAEGYGYAISRPPSYPLLEFASILLHGLGPAALLTLMALLSGACAVLFAAIWRRLIGPGSFFAGVALSLTPVFFSSSVQFMDHMPALLFLLAALWFCVPGAQRPVIAGAFFGLCVATRLSMLPLAVPVLMLALGGLKVEGRGLRVSATGSGAIGGRSRIVLSFVLPFLIITILFYALPIYHFGTQLLAPLDIPPDDFKRILFRASARVWGVAGSVAVVCVILWVAMRWGRLPKWGLPAATGVVIGYLVFVRFPFDYGYLLPVAPFVLLLAGAALPRRALFAVFAALAVGPFLSLNKDMRLEGTAISDLKTARDRHREVSKAVLLVQQDQRAVVALADLAPEAELLLGVTPLTIETTGIPDSLRSDPPVTTKIEVRPGFHVYVLRYNKDVVEAVSGEAAKGLFVREIP